MRLICVVALLSLSVAPLAWAGPPATCGATRPTPAISGTSPRSFTIVQGGSSSSVSETLTDISGQSTQSWSATASSAGNWLQISPTSSSTMASSQTDSITITAVPGSLTPNTYTGSVSITPATGCGDTKQTGVPATGSPLVISVSLTITAAPAISLSANSGSASVQQGGSGSVGFTLSRTNYTGSVSLAVTGLPTGVTATPSNPGTGTSGSVGLQAASNAPAVSNQTVTVTASGSGVSNATATFSVSVTTPPPVLALSSNQLSFSTLTGSSPGDQTFQVTNTGGGTLAWSASAVQGTGGSWLSVSPGSGNAPGTLTAHVSSAALQAGNYSATISVSSSTPGVQGSPQSVSVSLSVNAPPSISLSAQSGSVSLLQGGSGSVGFTLSRTNFAGSVSLAVSGLPTGVTATPSNPGTGTSGSVNLQAASNAPAVSNQTVTVTASGSGVSNASATFSVSVTTSPPILALTSNQLSFSTANGASPNDQNFQVVNNGPGALTWNASVGAITGGNWLSVSPGSGSAPGTVTVHVSSSTLAAGNYSATISVSSSTPGVQGSPQSVSVSLSVASAASIGVSALTNAVNLVAGGTAQSLTVAIARNSYTGGVTIAASGLPSGVTPTYVQPGSGSSGSISFVAAANAAAVSNQSITLTASGSGVPDTSTTFFLTVTSVAPGISIVNQPASATIASGQTATLSVSVSGGTSFSYNWYRGASGDTSNPVRTVASSSATSDSFTTPALTATTSYWVRVSNGSSTADSVTATETVASTTQLSIVTQPASTTIGSGQTASLSVVVAGAGTTGYSFAWFRGVSGDTSTLVRNNPIVTGTSDTFGTPALTATTSYWVRITNGGVSVDSNTATVTVTNTPTLSIVTQPAGVSIAPGATGTLSVTVSGTGPFTYNWYQGASGVTTTLVKSTAASTATSNTFTTPALTASTNYWVNVTSGSLSVNSNTATVTISAPKDQVLNYALPSTGTCTTSFFISTAMLPATENEGVYSAIVSISQGLLAGGFNLGGGFAENGLAPGFGQFKTPTNLPAASVTIKIDAQALPGTTGVVGLIATLNKETPTGRVLIQTVNGIPPLTMNTPNLDPGTFYTVVVSSTANSPRGTYQMQMIAPSGGFEGGVVAGGYAIHGLTNYGGFCLPVSQTVNVQLQGASTFGAAGAGNMVVGMMDSPAGKVYNPTP